MLIAVHQAQELRTDALGAEGAQHEQDALASLDADLIRIALHVNIAWRDLFSQGRPAAGGVH